ncbi:Glucose-induced degradation protein 8-like protein [Golovinomyces cichoracearum]|uniref:Glucose-induced degradation protein 8-like protein n=1 Tax=Golovinomyces cichoracearum TaxID=62708 RepID=A0A420J5L0_9PEZI|nr:Glucose-induced degradation protein 8-like protein [Golovinomyces cichoracearum]
MSKTFYYRTRKLASQFSFFHFWRTPSHIADTDKASSTAKLIQPEHLFHKRAEDVSSSKSDINKLILDYLTTEGYPFAAAKFSKEANLRPQQDEESIRSRHEIIHSIHSGDIQAAIDALNELDPEVMDRNPSLQFDLLRLQLVELIRDCNSKPQRDITQALNFASRELAPRAPNNRVFMEDLEKTMTLLVFPSESLEPSSARLLEPTLRRTVADKVNLALLSRQKANREASIRNLVRLRAWAEITARTQKIDLPSSLKLNLTDDDPKKQEDDESKSII